MNQLALTATVLELKPLRYTPAGVPAIEMQLEHESDVMQAGLQRRISMTVSAVALGDIALLLADTPLGAQLAIEGFLAPTRKGSGKLVDHIQKASRAYAGSGSAVV